MYVRILLIILLAAFPVGARAGADFQLDLASRYIWRGFDVFHDNHPALQPSLTVGFEGSPFSINLWGSFILENRKDLAPLDEFDFTLMWDVYTSDRFEIETGIIHYGYYWDREFSFRTSTTQEVYLSASLSDTVFGPKLTVFYDFNQGDGVYALLEAEHSFPVGEKIGLDLWVSLGYNGGQYIRDSGFSDLVWGASVPVRLGGFSVAPFISGCVVFLDSINEENEFWYGISVGN